ncbi:MAG: tryptophan synthase subunit alpha [Desulfuromonas sp.]|nr:MAG: tryptophan synthase subunit alpha [Desulfuromonas sp.]
MNRIESTFNKLKDQGRKALVPFVTAGDPSLEATARLIPALAEAGADIIELGVPFSDPMADGPTIQASSLRALEQGVTLKRILDMVAEVRKSCEVPIVLMGYFNPVFCYGVERFAADAGSAGVDGILIVDLPPEEAQEIRPYLKKHQIDFITLLAPTTPENRQRQLAAEAEGYIYYVSMTGVTGVATVNRDAIADAVTSLRQHSPVPVAVGFGVNSPETAAGIAAISDGVVVGSALIKKIEEADDTEAAIAQATTFVQALRRGIDQV